MALIFSLRPRERKIERETQSALQLRRNSMINPNGDEFMEDDRMAAPIRTNEERISAEGPGRQRQAAEEVSTVAGDAGEQTKVRASTARERTELLLRSNLVTTWLGARAP